MRVMLTMVMMLVATTTWAADAQTRLTEAKLAADLGRAEAVRLFGELAEDQAAPMGIRCEAWVRHAAGLAPTDAPRSAAQFLLANRSECGKDVEAMRILVEAITGMQQDPATWRGREEPVRVVVAHGKPILFFGNDDMPTVVPTPGAATASSAEAISMSMKDAELSSVLSLFSQFTGTEYRLDPPEMGTKTVTLEVADVPWDEVLALILQVNGLRYEQDAQGVRIFANQYTKLTGDAALLETVALSFQAHRRDHGTFPMEADWTPVRKLATLVEPNYVARLPRQDLLGNQILYRSSDGKSAELRLGTTIRALTAPPSAP